MHAYSRTPSRFTLTAQYPLTCPSPAQYCPPPGCHPESPWFPQDVIKALKVWVKLHPPGRLSCDCHCNKDPHYGARLYIALSALSALSPHCIMSKCHQELSVPKLQVYPDVYQVVPNGVHRNHLPAHSRHHQCVHANIGSCI